METLNIVMCDVFDQRHNYKNQDYINIMDILKKTYEFMVDRGEHASKNANLHMHVKGDNLEPGDDWYVWPDSDDETWCPSDDGGDLIGPDEDEYLDGYDETYTGVYLSQY